MNEGTHGASRSGPNQRTVESGVAIATAIFALIVIVGATKAGIGWAIEGPQAGFFPFYVGLSILIASGINLYNALKIEHAPLFADRNQLRQVFFVVLPTAIYVFVIPWIGIYFASGILIGFFMKRLGSYPWHTIGATAVAIPLGTFVIFERWFLVPLPKGPIEAWLGY